ncbi:MAG: SDR family oxidoreductase [Planctomycetes bacterium]|nr:SDR family oxidoreductase [Planctomycetota bacterium]
MGLYADLVGKRVVITGAASGIGLATAERFLAEGSEVVIFDWNQAALDEVLGSQPKLKGAVKVDVSCPEEVGRGFAEVDKILGGVDVLVSNAGVSYRRGFLEIDYEQWSKVLRVNLDGMFLCCQAAIGRMKGQGRGVVLLTGSTNGLEGHRWYADYNASKAGVIVLAKTLALEFAPQVRVNAVCPGYVLTPMQKAEYSEEMLAEVNAGIPLGRHARPEEVANLFAWLASEQAEYVMGQAICIDGGETAGA